ncbi:glycoside hydrolase family 88 protein [Chitinophaga oryziterrae]|uniref:Glycoside hydrolase family 88 protein n=1 Tax=Chitinophaga oryziterrae TaxID=1031224 RepID=A0A6N8JG57_9BACT|nr:glycoside hydrolase family 88 protein [Chitinophaga oryziterrae]MVT43934.1 glycoside hydrolase family 88 protein [Chitinophaga oryziterrae]
MQRKRTALFFLLLMTGTGSVFAQSAQMAVTMMRLWKDSLQVAGRPAHWAYDQGVVLEGFAGLWKNTGDAKYFRYIQKGMDHFVDKEGNIATYKQEDFNIDNIKNGRSLLLLYKVTNDEKYHLAAAHLMDQLRKQPRTNDGGFWHKKRYPYQMWLDGLYMGEPFYAEYAALFHEDKAFDDITRQFVLMEQHARDANTGLLYHGWDESRQQRWANKTTGRSPNFWGRAMGWYGMALADALEFYPANHPGRDSLLQILKRTATAIQKYQDPASGCWYQVLDKPKGKGNYLEASASCMFVYTLAKAVRLGYLPATYLPVAEKGFKGITKQFVRPATEGGVNLEGTVSVAGLGGDPYRDGSYEYYLSEKVVENDPKGVGAYMMAANELDMAAIPKTGKGLTISVDNYFNNEWRKDAGGQQSSWHYVWSEMDNGGYSLWGHIFHNKGVRTNMLSEAPTAASLAHTNIFLMVDPDTEKETSKPNYMNAKDAEEIYNWVKKGGVLVIMQNDSGNAEIKRFNTLTERFGMHFNEDSKNHVTGTQFEQGALYIPAGNAVFPNTKKVYIKELSTINVSSPATAVYSNKGDVIMAVAKIGKGTVFAVGDPWFYNEYLDGRRLSPEFENYQAATDLADWLIKQAKH